MTANGRTWASIILAVSFCLAHADPETVQGLLDKRSFGAPQSPGLVAAPVVSPNHGGVHHYAKFQQDSLGRGFHHSGKNGEKPAIAFGAYLQQPQPYLGPGPISYPNLQQDRRQFFNSHVSRVDYPNHKQGTIEAKNNNNNNNNNNMGQESFEMMPNKNIPTTQDHVVRMGTETDPKMVQQANTIQDQNFRQGAESNFGPRPIGPSLNYQYTQPGMKERVSVPIYPPYQFEPKANQGMNNQPNRIGMAPPQNGAPYQGGVDLKPQIYPNPDEAKVKGENSNRLNYPMSKLDEKRRFEGSSGYAYPGSQKMGYPYYQPPTPSENPPPSPNSPPASASPKASVRPQFKYVVVPTTTAAASRSTEEDTNSTVGEPVVAMLKQEGLMNAASKSAFGNDDDISGQSVASLVIGLTFVAAFISSAVGLVIHNMWDRIRQKKQQQKPEIYGRTRRVKSPNEEDQTPPELRGCGQPSFVQPDLSPNGTQAVTSPGQGGISPNGSKTGAGFLNGKLIFHDPPGNYLRSNGTHHLPPSALGAIPKQKMLLPSKAAVTDDLISPKYDDDNCNDESTDDGDDDDEESDDTVYECPGLASSSGGMVIKNPFFTMHNGGDGGSALPPPLEAVKAQLPVKQSSNNNTSNNNLNTLRAFN